MRRVLLIGATGQFGQRLARHLAGIAGIELLLASRSAARAEDIAYAVGATRPSAVVKGIAFDRDFDPSATLERLAPWLVIDASGPFQFAGYDLARAALASGAHWIDLADARDYLNGFAPALDALARDKGLTAAAGASSTPALSSAVVAALTHRWQRIDTVDIAILPAGRTEVGRAVIEAVLSYAGKPITVWEEGRPQTTIAWGRLQRWRLPYFGWRRLAPVETSDADILPALFEVRARVAFYAGLESRVERLGLLVLARLHAKGLIKTLQPFARWLENGRRLTRPFAGEDGGMIVEVRGLNEGRASACARWSLLAERGDGPHVPVLAALALTRKMLDGTVRRGAATANAFLDLKEIETEMEPLALSVSRSAETNRSSLFERALAESAYDALPTAVRDFHADTAPPVWIGRTDVTNGTSVMSRLIRNAFGFAAEGRDVPVTVTVERREQGETWTRNFAGRKFHSHLRVAGGHILSEHFGPFAILLALTPTPRGLAMPVAGWRLLGLTLPEFLAPKSEAEEYEDKQGRFRFDVRISAPLIGLIVHYRGWLAPQQPDITGGARIDAAAK